MVMKSVINAEPGRCRLFSLSILNCPTIYTICGIVIHDKRVLGAKGKSCGDSACFVQI